MTSIEDRMFTRRIVEFTARVHRACPTCQAPGQYLSDPNIVDLYPVLFNPMRSGEAVGNVCPNCGSDRPASTESRAKRREWWVFRLPNWMARLSSVLSR